MSYYRDVWHEKIQIQNVFINDFELKQDIIDKDNAFSIKLLIDPKGIVANIKMNLL